MSQLCSSLSPVIWFRDALSTNYCVSYNWNLAWEAFLYSTLECTANKQTNGETGQNVQLYHGMNSLTFCEWDIAIIIKLLVLSTLEDQERWKKKRIGDRWMDEGMGNEWIKTMWLDR